MPPGHGHLAGDLALQVLGLLVRGFCQASDVACRYGGEEFVLIMPSTTAAQATDAAGRGRDRTPPREVSRAA